jgi:hypothetical protein
MIAVDGSNDENDEKCIPMLDSDLFLISHSIHKTARQNNTSLLLQDITTEVSEEKKSPLGELLFFNNRPICGRSVACKSKPMRSPNHQRNVVREHWDLGVVFGSRDARLPSS